MSEAGGRSGGTTTGGTGGRGPTSGSRNGGSARPGGSGGSSASGGSSKPGGSSKSGGSAKSGSGRPPLAQRLQSRISAATTEHRANSKAKRTSATAARSRPAKAPRGPRRARLRLTRIDPWSVMKTSFLLSIAFGVVTVVAVSMIWSVLDAAGVWDSINSTIQESVGGEDTANLDVENYVGTTRVLGFTMLVAALDVILITAIATLGAFLYNLSAALLGGIEVTLAEDQG